MKKILLLLITLISSLFLTGCINYTELNELLVVTSIGIDYQDDNYIVYLYTIDSKTDDGSIEKEYKTLKEKASTISEAFTKLYQKSNKKIYLSHLDLLVLSEFTLKTDLSKVIKSFLYDIDNRSSFNIITTNNIEKLFQADDFPNKVTSIFTTNQKEMSSYTSLNFDTFITNVIENNTIIVPKITVNTKNNNQNNKTNNENTKQEDEEETNVLSEEDIIYQESIIVKENNIEKINYQDVIIYNYLTNNIKRTTINEINVLDNYTVLKTENNKIKINIISNIYDKDQKKFPEMLKKEINRFLDTYYKDKKIDILNLEKLIYQNHYNYYKKYQDDLINLLDFKIDLKVSLVDTEVIYEK